MGSPTWGTWIGLTATLLCGCSSKSVKSEPERVNDTVRQISLEVERQADGAKYPTDVKERYALRADSTLEYSAYFGGVPIEMNHNDRTEWAAGVQGREVLSAVREILGDPGLRSEVELLPDDAPPPDGGMGYYVVSATRAQADETLLIRGDQSKAFKLTDRAFTAMISEFERNTGRPRKATELPQR